MLNGRTWKQCCLLLAAVSWSMGCSKSAGPSAKPNTATKQGDKMQADKVDDHEHGDGHDHHAPGPHEGTLADWGGGKYHVEFVVDHDKQESTIYILGNDEKTASPIKAKEIQLNIKSPAFEVALKAAPQQGDPEGSSSRFVGKHQNLGKVQEFAGTVSGVVDGTPYSGEFKEEAHSHAHEK